MYRKHFEGNRPVGRDRFEYILDKYNLKVRKKKRKPRTTDSRHGLPTYPNQAKSYEAKYSQETDSEPVPWGKGEKHREQRSEKVPETVRLQAVGAS